MVAVLRTATSGQRGRFVGDIRTAGRHVEFEGGGFASDGDKPDMRGGEAGWAAC